MVLSKILISSNNLKNNKYVLQDSIHTEKDRLQCFHKNDAIV
jgi:hypothetical protein